MIENTTDVGITRKRTADKEAKRRKKKKQVTSDDEYTVELPEIQEEQIPTLQYKNQQQDRPRGGGAIC